MSTSDKMADRSNACDDCGLLFDTMHDVQRHIKSGACSEHQEPLSNKRKQEDTDNSVPVLKMKKLETVDSDEDLEDNEAYLKLWKRATLRGEDKYSQMYNKYVSNGENKNDAKQLAEERIEVYDQRNFMELYYELLESYVFPLSTSYIHQKIMSEVDKMRVKGISLPHALKRVLRKYKPRFQSLFDESGDEDSSDETDDESSDTEEQ